MDSAVSYSQDLAQIQQQGKLLITGYRPALAKKVIDNVPTLAAKGLTRQDAEDFVTIFEATGATASVVAM